MGRPDDTAWLDATAQAELVRRGEATPAELVDAAIARIDAYDAELNAVIHKLYDKARAAAEADLPHGPFRGVPFLVKDAVAHTAGDPYHCGMRLLKEREWTEPADSYLVERFRAAGFVIVGKTNTPELASDFTTEPEAYGASRNPWDRTRSTGGSSGGSGAAVASGMVPVAHGNDMGGSIRVPSAHCGLVGLKPSRARTSLGPGFGEYWGMLTHEHVLTRSVRDTAAVLDCTAGARPGDPYTAPPPARPWRDEVGVDPGRLRVGFRTAIPGRGVDAHPDTVAAVTETAALLASLDHEVDPSSPAALDDDFSQAVLPYFASAISRDVDRWSQRLGVEIGEGDIEGRNWFFHSVGQTVTAPQLFAITEWIQGWSRRLASWWADGYDLLLTPTFEFPPPLLGQPLDPDAAPGRFTMPWDFTGQPAISLPLHWNADGLPIGVQLVAPAWREDLLIRVASQLEAARPWADRHPTVPAI
ncbi:MAG TPA: amidase [Acidimicrobiales bacterium]|nr:amidase [Acidimicrobiales bacterium]